MSRRRSSRPTPSRPPTTAELTTTDVRRVWPELLAVVKRHKRTTEALLKNAQVHQLANGVLTLSTSSPALARRLGDDLNKDVIREALNELLGVRWRVDAVVEGAAGGHPGRPSRRPRPREAARAAEAAEARELMAERAAEDAGDRSPSPPSTRSRPRCRCCGPSSAPAPSTAEPMTARDLPEEERAIVEAVAHWVDREVRPQAGPLEREQEYPPR